VGGKKWVAGLRDICILLHIDRATVLQDGHTYKQFAYYYMRTHFHNCRYEFILRLSRCALDWGWKAGF
jgi:hypothetical protein